MVNIWDITRQWWCIISLVGLFQREGITTLSGYVSFRYRKCVDLMIMKKENNFEFSYQRKLGILDPEFNNNNNFVSKTICASGLKLGTIAVE